MKKITILSIFIATALGSIAQVVTDTVHTDPTYANDNYYTLNDGNQYTVARNNWDLAFTCSGLSGFGSTVRINGASDGSGTELYLYSADTADWSTLDTTGFSWAQNQLFNADTSWETGAFNSLPPSSGFDLGWGTYNMTTHFIIGDRLFIIKLSDGTYRKLVIESLISGVYTIRYADLNGANLTTATITKSNYTDKNFGYYSIQSATTIDREPLTSSWDLLFTKYVTMLAPNTYYPVTGVLAHQDVRVAQVNNVNDPYTESHIGPTYGHYTNIIGYDWKSFNMTTFQFDIDDSLVYFVQDQNNHIFRLVFTGFTGSSAGEYHLDKEKITGVGIDEDITEANTILNVYPNPASDNVTITYNAISNFTSISIFDLTGKEVLSKQINTVKGLSQEKLNVVDLTQGVYFLRIASGQNISTQKLIVQ